MRRYLISIESDDEAFAKEILDRTVIFANRKDGAPATIKYLGWAEVTSPLPPNRGFEDKVLTKPAKSVSQTMPQRFARLLSPFRLGLFLPKASVGITRKDLQRASK